MLNPKNKLYRWGPVSACPLFLYFSIESAFKPLKKLFGTTYSESLIIFRDGKGTWLLDDKELAKRSEKFVNKALLNKVQREKYLAIWEKRTKTLEEIFITLNKIDIASLSPKDLTTYYKKLAHAYNAWFVITISLELVATSLEPLLGTHLKNYYKDTTSKAYQEAFSTLTAPLALTFYRQEQYDLLKILLLPKIQQDNALNKHQEKYYWIYNSYAEGKVLNVSYFKTELQKQAKTDYKKVLLEIENYTPLIKKQKAAIIAAIKPTSEEKDIIHLIERFAQLLDKRKAINFKAEHYLELFVKQFSSLVKISPKLLKFLLPMELADVLNHVDTSVLENRADCFVLECSEKDIKTFSGKNAAVIANQFDNVNNVSDGVISGVVASVGKEKYFRGTAKIVLTIEEIHKINEGDILITPMTSPDFVIGMKKAGAIITETGGMLSHAAIVSREFGIPCIVGTEIATRVIHDGDVIELHCGQGTVKIIKPQ